MIVGVYRAAQELNFQINKIHFHAYPFYRYMVLLINRKYFLGKYQQVYYGMLKVPSSLYGGYLMPLNSDSISEKLSKVVVSEKESGRIKEMLSRELNINI